MRRRLNFKLIIFTLGGLLLTSAATHGLHEYQVWQNAHGLLERGDRAVEQKKFDKALSIYGQYLALAPNDADAVQKYAQVLDRRVEDVDERVQLVVVMEQVLRVKPQQDAFRLRLVHNLIALGRYAEAVDHLQKLLPTASDQAEIYHMIGWCRDAKKDDFAEAAKSFEKAVQLDPKRIASYALLIEIQQDRLHRPEDALKTMDAMVQANPKSPEAHLLRARQLRRRGDDAGAERDLKAAALLSPEHAEVILELADAARARGQLDAAARVLRDGIKRHPSYAAFHKALADLALRSSNLDAAIAELEAGLKKTPEAHDLAVLLVDLLIDQKQYEAARTKLAELQRANLRSGLLNYLAARLHFAQGQLREAIGVAESGRRELASAPAAPAWAGRVNALLGASYRQLGDLELALEAYRRAVEAEPTWSTAFLGLASALLADGRVAEANQVLEPVLDRSERPMGFWPLLARSRLERQRRLPADQRRWEGVEEALAEAERVEPGQLDVPLLHADLCVARGDAASARAWLEKARAAHPDQAAPWIALADLTAQLGFFEAAEKIIEQAALTKGLVDRAELWHARIGLWSARGNVEDQVKLTSLGAHLPTNLTAPERVQLQRALAAIWQQRGKTTRAAELHRAIAAAEPTDVRSRFALFELALKRGDLTAAQRWQAELRGLQDGPLARFAEAALLVRQAKGKSAILAEARAKLMKLESVQKDWPRIPLLLATISEMEGKLQQAIEEYSRALRFGAADTRTLVRLVELLLARREFSKAESALAKYEQQRPLTRELARLGAEAALGLRDRTSALLAVRRAELAVALPSRDYRDYLWLGPIYRAAGDQVRAEEAFRTALDLAGYAPDAWIAWLEHLVISKQRPRAFQEIERLKKELPADRLALTLARCYAAMHEPKLAASAFDAALEARPDDFAPLVFAAEFYRSADQPSQARQIYKRLLEPSRSIPAQTRIEARRQLAILLAASDPPQALDLIAENATESPADERIRLYIRGQNERARPEAIAQFQESLRREPPSPQERLLLADLLQAAGNLADARTQLAAAVGDEPHQPRSLVRYASVLIRLAELDEAASVIARLEALEPSSPRTGAVRSALAAALAKADVKK